MEIQLQECMTDNNEEREDIVLKNAIIRCSAIIEIIPYIQRSIHLFRIEDIGRLYIAKIEETLSRNPPNQNTNTKKTEMVYPIALPIKKTPYTPESFAE